MTLDELKRTARHDGAPIPDENWDRLLAAGLPVRDGDVDPLEVLAWMAGNVAYAAGKDTAEAGDRKA